MANNVTIPATGSGDATPKVSTEQIAGTLEHKQIVQLAVPGSTLTNIPADAANGLDVDVTRVQGTVTVRPSDGTNSVTTMFDADSGAGTQYVQGVSLRKSASGGSVEAGTASDPLRFDPTGTTTQPISASSLPLPSGAATSAKQPAFGTAGTPSADVITVQGKSGMTPVVVDGSGVTQPVSGTVTANIGSTNGLALDATLTGGTQKAIVRGGAKGSTTAADVTSTASGANHQPLDVALYDASGNQVVPGQTVSASSLPVVVASDQTPINVLAAVIPVVTYSSFILADSNSVLWTTTMSDAGVLVTSPSPSGSVATTIFLNDVGAHTSYQVTVSTLGVIAIVGVTYNAGYQTILGFTTTSGYQSALYIGGGALLSRTPAPYPNTGLPKNAAQETGGNLALIASLLQNQQKTVDILERILGCLEAHKLMFADVGAGYIDTDETIKNIQ
jgi:hypothetical protein